MTEIFRRAKPDEIATMIEWAAREGWNPGVDDLDPFAAADPEGYWLADVSGRPAASISLVHHRPDYAFLGFYIADPAFRGQGIAYRLWQSVLSQSPAAVIGLDGVVAQQDNYRKSGFVYAHANRRYGGQVAGERAGAGVCRVGPDDLAEALAYDARHNPGARPRFMSAWLTDAPTRRSFLLRRGERIAGLGTIRACREGCKVGPLFADDAAGAESLFRHMAAEMGGGTVYLDIPAPNAEARLLCERHGMAPVFETARMYRGAAPELPLGNIFGITTFELG
jgi:GNAT superfamily N-acetyltransferase